MPRPNIKVPMLRYLGYASFIWAKKILGLHANRNRKFSVWKLMKLINSGVIDKNNLSVTSMGRPDGVGAQAMAKFSTMCFAQAYNIRYVHVPFESLAHAELPLEEWIEQWERILNMNIENNRLDPDTMHVVGLSEYIESPPLWKKKVVVADLHLHAFCELAPSFGTEVSKKLQIALNKEQSSSVSCSDFIIGVHVRRGDVRKGDVYTNHRFTPNQHTIAILKQVVEVVSHSGYSPQVQVHTNGSIEELADFLIFPGVQLYACTPAIETFIALSNSDVLISARSDFSMLAGIYCKGIVICDPRQRTPLKEWIKVTPNHINIREELERKLKNLSR